MTLSDARKGRVTKYSASGLKIGKNGSEGASTQLTVHRKLLREKGI